MKQTVTQKLVAAFDAEIKKFLSFIERTSTQPGGTRIREAIVDDPYWNPYLEWRSRMIAMERLLQAVGVRRATIAKSKAVLPEKLRTFDPIDDR